MLRSLLQIIFLMFVTTSLHAQDLQHLASYMTGEEGSAETVAYDSDSKLAFFTNSSTNSFSIVDISDPNTPVLVSDIALDSYGGGPNSIAVYGGLVAVAVEANEKTEDGMVVFFDTAGVYLSEVTAGALPDMITFTPDGSKLLVANEGEPNDDYTVDPNGSVSIISLENGPVSATVQTIDFSEFDDRKASLINKGVRIFGNNFTATVAQDLEPEYITTNADGSIAYVNCQEANALAVLDVNAGTWMDILPLGFKDHSSGRPSVTPYILNEMVADWPVLGTPVYDGGQDPVLLGGFSGLFYAADESTEDNHVFYAIPDRGPNDGTASIANVTPTPAQNLRPFKLPNYQARIVQFTLDQTSGTITLGDSIFLHQSDGMTPISGRGNIEGFDEVPVTYADPNTDYANVDYTDADGEEYHALPYDPFGGDFEGILKDKEGSFWMCDEYRPAIYKFTADGTLMDRFVPAGTSTLGSTAAPEGTFGSETLPAVYAKRRANRGFEAIAYDSTENVIYAFIQSPIENPDSDVRNNTDVIRILGVSATDGTPVSEYVYLLERNKDSGYASSRVDKIGDAFYTGDGKFLVLERDSEGPDATTGKKYVYEIDITLATNTLDLPISTFDGSTMDTTLEQSSADQLVAAGIRPVQKYKVLNLPSVGYMSSDKPEGVALLPDGSIAVLNDNDFGLAGAGITDNSVLGIISFDDSHGFDASNRDDAINIDNHPTLGMYMPDGIASYEVDGITYIVTVNEGDSRDYDGYSEEERVADITLNPSYYPDAAALQDDADLGRLKTTIATGDYDQDGTFEQIYSYGARSFSIFDQYGNLVYDSGNEFAKTVEAEEPELFNEDEGEIDGRSDDKGVEPEAIAIGTIGDFTYAFVGLERQSGIIVYDITNPQAPTFVTYYNNRVVGDEITGDVAPEIIRFVPADESPNQQNLLLVGYEVSGSLGIVQIGDVITSLSEAAALSQFTMYPNPVVGQGQINFDINLSGEVFDMEGRMIKRFDNASQLDVHEFRAGMYVIRTSDKGAQRFLKLD